MPKSENLWGASVLRAVSVIGIILSGYATYAEYQMELDPNFVALCDIGEWAKCSKVRKCGGGTGCGT
jgi:hypothetical protein